MRALEQASNVAMLTRIISGIASASIPAAQAYIVDESSRAKEMGRISMAFGLGLVFGPPLGGLLSSIAVGMSLRPKFSSRRRRRDALRCFVSRSERVDLLV